MCFHCIFLTYHKVLCFLNYLCVLCIFSLLLITCLLLMYLSHVVSGRCMYKAEIARKQKRGLTNSTEPCRLAYGVVVRIYAVILFSKG